MAKPIASLVTNINLYSFIKQINNDCCKLKWIEKKDSIGIMYFNVTYEVNIGLIAI